MGCSGSVSAATVSDSNAAKSQPTNSTTTKSDVVSDHSTRSIQKKQFAEISTQTDDIQKVDVCVDATINTEVPDKNENIPPNHSKVSNIDDSLKNSETKINPFDITTVSMSSNPRLSARPINEALSWILNGVDAQFYCLMIQKEVNSIGPNAIKEAVEALKSASELKSLPQDIWNLFDVAVQKGDASYLIRAYTAESDFYKILNQKLAKLDYDNGNDLEGEQLLQQLMGTLFQQFNQTITRAQAWQGAQQLPIQNNNETNWAKLYLRPIFSLLATPNSSIRFQGPAYRGMWISREELDFYTGTTGFICHKAITSTSKRREVAQGFIDRISSPSADMIAALFIYNVESYGALYAMDITNYSLIPSEEEVLLLPGVFYTIANIEITHSQSVEIELRSSIEDVANAMSSSINSLFSLFAMN